MKRFKLILLFLTVILWPLVNAKAQVIHVNSSWTSNSGTTHSYNYTVGAGPDKFMAVGVSIHGGTGKKVNTMTFNGVAMTFHSARNAPDNSVRTEFWYMTNPPTGTYTLSTTFDASASQIIGITSFEGVDQTIPISTAVSKALESSSPSATISADIGGMVWDVITKDANVTLNVGPDQTERWNAGVSGMRSAGSTEPGAPSVTMSWSSGDDQPLSLIAVALKPSTTVPEICGNGIDDNNDGRTDEDIPGGAGDNLLLWLKADVGFTGTTWEDQGPKGNDGTVFGDPTQVTNSLNFNPGINFDGDDHIEVNLPELVFQNGYHSAIIFAVYKPSTAATTIGVLGNQAGGGTANIHISDGNYGLGSSLSAIPQAFGATHHLITYVLDEEDNVGGGTNESDIYHNGVLHASFTFDENQDCCVDSYFHIGKSGSNGASQFFQGDIHEIIIYYEWDGNAALTNAEIQQVESYLATKYGISLSHNFVDSQ